jgi:hypothetical protein
LDGFVVRQEMLRGAQQRHGYAVAAVRYGVIRRHPDLS